MAGSPWVTSNVLIHLSPLFQTIMVPFLVSRPCCLVPLCTPVQVYVWASGSKSASNEHIRPSIETGCLLVDVHMPSNGDWVVGYRAASSGCRLQRSGSRGLCGCCGKGKMGQDAELWTDLPLSYPGCPPMRSEAGRRYILFALCDGCLGVCVCAMIMAA